MGKPEVIPIIESLASWLLGQNQQIKCTLGESKGYVNLHHEKAWLGVVTLIYPGQEQRQALQYDWYHPDDHWPLVYLDQNSRYYRNIWQIADPSSFTEILARAIAIRDGSPVKWQEVYRPTEAGIRLVEAESA